MLDTAESSAAVSTETVSSSSTPVDTASIAASVISDAEQGDQSGDVVQPKSEETPEKKAAPKTEALDEDDFDSVEAETTDSLGRKKPNSIPHPRVKKMIARREQKLIASVAKELGISKAEAELKLEDITGALTERKTKFTEYEERVKTAEAIEAIMEMDENRFIRLLAEMSPERYGKFAKVLEAAADAPPKDAVAGADDPEPEPDYDLGNGTKTYSLEGMRALRAWERRQGRKDAEALINERLTPIEKERQQREQRQREQERIAKVREDAEQAVSRTLERAAKWPRFTENAEEIGKLIDADPQLDLVDAYMQVVMPKLSTDRTAMRKELLAEINGQPKDTSTASAAAAAPKATKARTTSDVAREVIASMA